MTEKILVTIKNEKNERQDVEVLIDDIELTQEMEEELTNNKGDEE